MHIKTIHSGFALRAAAITFVIAFAASGGIYGQVPAASGPYRAETPANRGLDATLYMQTAAEYRASCYQAYKWAAIQLEALAKAKKATATKPFAVIMDLDETVLDNSRFQAMLLRNGLAWDKDLWKQWERDHSDDLTLIPGAKEFIEKAASIEKKLGPSVDVFFVSNRNGKEFKQQAQDALTRLGVPPKDAEHLKLVVDPEGEDSQNKTERFQQVRDHYDVLLYIGDNLRDFSEELAFDKLGFGKVNKAPEEKLTEIIQARRDKVDSGQAEKTLVRDRLGTDWIILPNPTYGDWKAPLGRGESDFNRLISAVFPFPTPSASPSPGAHKECAHKKCASSQKRNRNVDPAIVAAVIAFLSAAALFFWQKWLERRSINRAILAEIRRILTVVRSHRDWWEKRLDDKDIDHPLIPFSHDVYSNQVTNIGALTNRLVGRAVTFYGYLGFINSLQRARPEYIANGKRAEFGKMYLGVLTSFLADYEHAFDEDFGGIG
jgi:5'-nucleotidase (lipoprotein e(P4) family)